MPYQNNRKNEMLLPSECNGQAYDKLNEELTFYLKQNEKIKNELVAFRHHILNIMHGINGYIELEDWDGLKEYFYVIMKSFKPGNTNVNLSSIENLENPALKELLTNKLKKADNIGIDFKLMSDQNIVIEKELINEIDLCYVLGIFLDQAIEAALAASIKKISLYFLKNENLIDIIIENTFREKPNLPQLDTSSTILSKYPNIIYNTFVQHQVHVRQLKIRKS